MTETMVESTVAETVGTHLVSDLAGKYMTFRLANEVYGLELLKVREIIGMMDITRVARTEKYIRGVINLRGKVVPVIDQKMKLGLGPTEVAEQTVIIVVQVNNRDGELTIGILVDEVLEVLSIDEDQIEPPPNFGNGGDNVDFILGVGKWDKRVVFLLDIEKVLTRQDKHHLVETSQTETANQQPS